MQKMLLDRSGAVPRRLRVHYPSLVTLGLTLYLWVTIVLPLGPLLTRAFYGTDGSFIGLDNFRRYFASPALSSSLGHTLVISLASTILSVVLAFIYAYAICRSPLRWKNLFRFIAVIPLFAPSMVFGIALVYLLGKQGVFTQLGLALPLYGPLGIIISEVLYAFPQAYLILYAALSVTDARLYEVADSMGIKPLRQFITITLPSVRYALINASFATFILAFTDFGAPKVVGGNYNVLAVDMYKQVVGQQNMPMGAVVGLVLLAPTILAFAVDAWVRSRQEITLTSKAQPLELKAQPLRDTLLFAYCSLVAILLLGMLLTVVIASVVKFWPYDLHLTLEHYLHRSEASGGMRAYGNSILIAVCSAVLGTAVTFLTAYTSEKTRTATVLRQTNRFVATLPLALPGLALGLAYIFFFNEPRNPLHFLYATPAILVLANIAHFFSVPYLAATTALKKLDNEFEEVGESMAVPQWRTFLYVSVPLCLPTLLENAVYLFTNAMITISAVIFLYPPRFKLASIAIVNLDDAGDVAPAAAMSVLVVGSNLLVRALYLLGTKRLLRRYARWQMR